MTYELKRKQDESFDEYHIRLFEDVDLHELNSHEIAKLLNDEYGSNYNESKWRKDYAQYRKWKDFIVTSHVEDDSTLEKITIKKLELQKERNKLSAEKNELNKWIREQARTENLHDKVLDAIERLEPITFPSPTFLYTNVEKRGLVDIADAHFGAQCKIEGMYGETLAEYNVEIFKERMSKLLEHTVQIIEKEKLSHVTVLNLSDSIDGLLHMNQLQLQQLGVTDQVMQFAEYMSQWLNELSKYAEIDYRSVLGNHCESRPLNSQRGELPQENMERLITWFIKARLENNSRVNVFEAKNLIYFDVLGTKILATHGQDERSLENSIKDYMMIYDVKVNQLRTGHLHHLNNKVIGMDGIRNIEHVQVPSICGINEYSLKLKKTSNAGTLITVYDEDGVYYTRPVNFGVK